MRVRLSRDGEALADSETGSDGRIASLGGDLPAGSYTLTFEIGPYFAEAEHLYDRVTLEFTLRPGTGHHHVPLLVAPYSVSSYRGS